MSKRRQSDSGGAGFAIIVFLALLWWLRWLILAGAVITVLVIVGRWLLRRHLAYRRAELSRRSAMRQRAEIQNMQVLRGDPHGFYGQYPLPDPELIPRWYKAR